MGERSVTVWTCDRCGQEYDTEVTGQPEAWVRLDVASPPKAAGAHMGVYCGRCWQAIVRFAAEPPPQQAKAS